jgi:1-acyl-sn-glycerol-3-phosphate acyltransferase
MSEIILYFKNHILKVLNCFVYNTVVWATKILLYPFFDIVSHAKCNYSDKKPLIFAMNHISAFDPFIVTAVCSEKIHYLAKSDLSNHWMTWIFLKSVGAVFIKRNYADIKGLKLALKLLKEKKSIGIFPEGKVDISKRHSNADESSQYKVDNLQTGVALLAMRSGSPIIPVLIQGTEDLSTLKLSLRKKRRLKVFFGEPINGREITNELNGTSYKEQKKYLVEILKNNLNTLNSKDLS